MRNKLKRLVIILFNSLILLACTGHIEPSKPTSDYVSSSEKKPVDYVWPWLDSANSRWFYFNTATRPFGLVNLSPDTELDGAWGSGYRYDTLEVKGFNHIHAWQLSGLSVMPIASEQALVQLKDNFYSSFSHENEVVKAGYHKLTLDRYQIDVELTATTRVGFHRYHFSKQAPRKILLDLEGQFGPVELKKGSFKQIDETTFRGSVINQTTRRRPRPTPVYFYIKLNTAVESVEYASGSVLLNLSTDNHHLPVLMKVAHSYVDEKGAQNNLATELSHWNFEQTVQEAQNEWNQWLSKIIINDKNEQKKVRFYTDLFHALQGRRIISDVDGRYSDQTSPERKIKHIPLQANQQPKFNHHNSDAFWGAQWTIQTLWPLAYPKVASDFANSMLLMYQDGGYIPRGPSGGNYTHVMTGASSTPFFVSNYMKGIRDYDIERAYQGLKKNHLPGGIMSRAGYEHNSTYSGGLEHYMKLGYVPYPLEKRNNAFHQDGGGQTLEYAFQDWTLSQLAKALNKPEDANYFNQRSQNYRHIYDPETGYMRPKNLNGAWLENFNPTDYRVGFVESNAKQMTWYVPHDYAGLSELMGSKTAAIERLNADFKSAERLGFTSGSGHASEAHPEYRSIAINYGNQPSMQTAFIFNELGAPHLTQYWSRKVVEQVYSKVTPRHGFNGDEDQGLMGALSVLMKIGLFQLTGGTETNAIYHIGSPVFDKIRIKLDSEYYSGREFVIETINNSDKNIYVQSAKLNGKPLNRLYLTHQEITTGGTLQLIMGAEVKSL